MKDFRELLTDLINQCSKENGSNTPDFILAQYLNECLKAFDQAVCSRREWYEQESRETGYRETGGY